MHRPTRHWLHPLAALVAAVGAVVASGAPAAAEEVVDPASALVLTVAPHDRTRPGEVLTLTAEVVDGADAPVTDGVVRFTVDGGPAAVVDLDAEGRAETTVTPPQGAHWLVATYPGRADLLGAVAEVRHSVLPERCPDQAVPGAGATVRHLYLVAVGRCPDATGLAHWTQRLAAGAPPDEVARAVVGGHEGRVALVDDAYRRLLGRPADPMARTHWAERLRRGEALSRLWAALGASPELARRAGGAGVVPALYDRVLGRPADPAGRAHWEARLARARSRGAVVLALLMTPEALGRTLDRAHLAALGRLPSPAERAVAVAAARRAGDWRPVALSFLSGPDLAAHAQTYPDPEPTG